MNPTIHPPGVNSSANWSLFLGMTTSLGERKLWILGDEDANMLDSDIVVYEFELQLRDYVYFRTDTLGKGMNPLDP